MIKSLEEKYEIAKQHLMTKVIKNNGLTDSQIEIKSSALKSIIANYTREAGVRNLERELNKVARKAAIFD